MAGIGTGLGIVGVIIISVLSITLALLIIMMPVFIYLLYRDVRSIKDALIPA